MKEWTHVWRHAVGSAWHTKGNLIQRTGTGWGLYVDTTDRFRFLIGSAFFSLEPALPAAAARRTVFRDEPTAKQTIRGYEF